MPLDPQIADALKRINALGLPPFEQLSVPDARVAAFQRSAANAGPLDPLAGIQDHLIPGPGGEIPVRLYTPHGNPPFPIFMYFHGGGWVVGHLDSQDPLCSQIAHRASCVVMSVDYRLAPEHKFPAAVEDCYAATAWVAEHGRSFSGDGSRLAVGGVSAGGNLAAVVSLMARDRSGPQIALQVLIVPVTNYSFDTDSYRDNSEGFMLTKANMVWYWDHYLQDPSDGEHPYASPLRAPDLRGLPPAQVVTAEYDPLRDEGMAYGERLRSAGVSVTATCYPGMVHGFYGMAGKVSTSDQALRDIVMRLRQAFE